MLRKLRLKFVAINMAIITVMLCIIFGLVYHFTQVDLAQENLNMMRAIATFPTLDQPGRLEAPPEEVRLPYFILQVERDGRISAFGGTYYDLSNRDFLQDLADQAASRSEESGVLEEYGLRFFRAHTPMGERMVFSDVSSERATLNGLIRTFLLIGILSLAAFLGLSLLLARWTVRPVEQAWKQQRQFVADASHELKTPLTVITTSAELLQENISDRTAVDNILTVSRQMRSLVERLLELARAEDGQSSDSSAPVDWSALVEEAVLPFEPVFFERGLSLEAHIQPNLTVLGRTEQLKQVVDILLDNAQKYALAPSAIYLDLEQTRHGRCRLTVDNQASELSPEELGRIFKRFYRVDPARSRDGSFGLGLSIAKQITESHRGRIWAQSENGRIRFFVELPCTDSGPRPDMPAAGADKI